MACRDLGETELSWRLEDGWSLALDAADDDAFKTSGASFVVRAWGGPCQRC